MFTGLVLQTRQRGVHVLRSDGERLADHLDGPDLPSVRRIHVTEPARNLSGFGRDGHKADVNKLHVASVPTAPTQKRVDRCTDRFAEEGPTANRLLVSLLYGRCLARLGLGARAVAPNSAAHASRVALTWPAQLRASSLGGERLKRGLLCSK